MAQFILICQDVRSHMWPEGFLLVGALEPCVWRCVHSSVSVHVCTHALPWEARHRPGEPASQVLTKINIVKAMVIPVIMYVTVGL